MERFSVDVDASLPQDEIGTVDRSGTQAARKH